ncbi:Crp/Fnr family transcriptional regulator [Caldimonas brevitalea]|uniref:Transcriptional regulator, Crp/Fnr family n=1 Tax=Caldimonas brevitalea TaxID=413882 RepID=A0A0G3BF19_9BURK|nr:Crp/Fnr family transcriptional regulator [Caldimonas brevitalea]AKJ28024.1 transcriptional regulator, Crp/Fnr family [Caldimonas brevitalea]
MNIATAIATDLPALRPASSRGTAPNAPRLVPPEPLRTIPLDARAALLHAALGTARVSRTAAHAMAQLAQEYVLAPSCPVFSRGDAAQTLWLLASGEVALGTAEQGRPPRQTRRVEPGQWVDAASAWLQGHYLEDAWTQSASVLWGFELTSLRACLSEHPSLAEGLITVLSGRVRELTEGRLGLMVKDAEARCATWVLQQAEPRAGAGGGVATVVLRERKRAIASQLAVTPETFSRVLRQWREKGVAEVEGYTLRVLDLPALQEIAEGTAAARA